MVSSRSPVAAQNTCILCTRGEEWKERGGTEEGEREYSLGTCTTEYGSTVYMYIEHCHGVVQHHSHT